MTYNIRAINNQKPLSLPSSQKQSNMDYRKLETINWILTIAFAVVVATFAWYLLKNKRKVETTKNNAGSKETHQLQLQAYERLTLLVERSKLEGLINRAHQNDYSAKDMQQALLQTLRQEFEHNITQQIYVTAGIWAAVEKMKDQNMYIINQLAAVLPPKASATDLNKSILEFTINNPDATMNKLILDAIQFEAKKLL